MDGCNQHGWSWIPLVRPDPPRFSPKLGSQACRMSSQVGSMVNLSVFMTRRRPPKKDRKTRVMCLLPKNWEHPKSCPKKQRRRTCFSSTKSSWNMSWKKKTALMTFFCISMAVKVPVYRVYSIVYVLRKKTCQFFPFILVRHPEFPELPVIDYDFPAGREKWGESQIARKVATKWRFL